MTNMYPSLLSCLLLCYIIPTARAHVTSSEPSLRLSRAALSPPTVTSMQAPMRGVSSTMHDQSLGAATQSEGPSHPSMMRNAPPRRLGTPFLVDHENLARPSMMFHEVPRKSSLNEATYTEEHDNNIYSDDDYYPLFNDMIAEAHVLDDYNTHRFGHLPQSDEPIVRNLGNKNMDNSLSRQRRLDNSEFQVKQGRFGRFDGGRPRIVNHMSGHNSELSSNAAAHPIARKFPPRTGTDLDREDNSVWSNGRTGSRFYRRFPNNRRESNFMNIDEFDRTLNSGTPRRSRGHILFHGASGMSSKGSVATDDMPAAVSVNDGQKESSQPMLFKPTEKNYVDTTKETEENTMPNVALLEFMDATNLSEEELRTELAQMGVSLDYLLMQSSNGVHIDIKNILAFNADQDDLDVTSTTLAPSINNWHRNTQMEPSSTEFSDSVYAAGVYPINEFIDDNMDEYESPLYSSEYYTDNHYHENNIDEYEGRAKIESLTVHEVPQLETHEETGSHQLEYGPYINEDEENNSKKFAGNDMFTERGPNLLLTGDFNPTAYVAEKRSSRPVTYTVIAAGAIMASLAIFTFFVLVAYTVVKCTKRPTLNNYNVNDKKDNDVTT